MTEPPEHNMSSPVVRQVSDHWRDDLRCYASQWGFRCGSEIAKLIEFVRDEHRAKYGIDYRLRRLGKNRFLVVPGDRSDYGIEYVVEAAQRFRTTVIGSPLDGEDALKPL